MNKPIHPDVAGFKDDFFKGLSLRETIYGFIALAVGAAGIPSLYFFCGININVAITICIPIVAVFGLCGFYRKNGMTLNRIVLETLRLARQKPFTYETLSQKQFTEDIRENKDKNKQRNKRSLKKERSSHELR